MRGSSCSTGSSQPESIHHRSSQAFQREWDQIQEGNKNQKDIICLSGGSKFDKMKAILEDSKLMGYDILFCDESIFTYRSRKAKQEYKELKYLDAWIRNVPEILQSGGGSFTGARSRFHKDIWRQY